MKKSPSITERTYLSLQGILLENDEFIMLSSVESNIKEEANFFEKSSKLVFQQLDSKNVILNSLPANIAKSADSSEKSLLIQTQILLHPETRKIILKDGDRELYISHVIENRPSISITGLGKIDENSIHVKWKADNDDRQSLTYRVYYMIPEGRIWLLESELSETEKTIDLSKLPGSNNSRIGIAVSSGLRSDMILSDPFSVSKKPLRIIFSEPNTNEPLSPDQPIVLRGSVVDVSGQTKKPIGMTWRLNGEIIAQNVNSHVIQSLEPGEYDISLEYQHEKQKYSAEHKITISDRSDNQERLQWIFKGRKEEKPSIK